MHEPSDPELVRTHLNLICRRVIDQAPLGVGVVPGVPGGDHELEFPESELEEKSEAGIGIVTLSLAVGNRVGRGRHGITHEAPIAGPVHGGW